MADQTNKPNQLQVILKEQHVDKDQAEQLVKAFGGPFNEVGEILADYKTIKVTDVNDTEGMAKARAKRLALKKARTTVENKRKELKEGIVKQGRAIDSIARFVKDTIAPAEEYLQLQEDYAKLEAQRAAEAKRAERLQRLSKYPVDPEYYNLDAMDDAAFDQLIDKLEAERLAAIEHQKNVEAQQKAEAEARAAAQKRRERDNARLRAVSALGFYVDDEGTLRRQGGYESGANFNELLELDDKAFDAKVDEFVDASDKQFAAEAEARKAEQAKQAKITERVNWLSSLGAVFNGTDYRLVSKVSGMASVVVSKQEVENDTDEAFAKALQLVENVAKANAEYDQRRDAELKAAREKEAAERKAKEEAEAAEREALLAPDKTKLLSFADALEMIRTTKLPAMKTKQGQDIVNDIDSELQRLKANITAKANRLK